ncbi:MAG: fatty acid desaturase family protein [Dehalococcoidia bacterium]
MSVPVTSDYSQLRRTVTEQGLLRSDTGYYILKTIIALATLGAAIAVAVIASHPAILIADAVFLAFASTQIALLAHDVGHRQGFRGVRANAIGKVVFGNFFLGVSHSWWNDKHNQHHATPNHIEKDPDIAFPFIAFASEQIETRAQWLRPIMAIQAFVFVSVLPLQAINFRISSITHLFSSTARRPLFQGAVMAMHFALYGLLLYQLENWAMALTFFAVHQGVFGLYNSSVFASNHKGMALISDSSRMDFLREQVLTSRNVTGRKLTDFWYGGLNYQIEHHLFPTMPRKNLSKVQPIVRAFCAEREIAYHETGLFEAYWEGLRHLHETSAPLRRRGPAKLATETR